MCLIDGVGMKTDPFKKLIIKQQGKIMFLKFQPNLLTLAISLSLASTSIHAQSDSPAEQSTNVRKTENSQDIELISILGSRASSRTATDSAVPVDIISQESLTKGGFTELGQSLQATAPSFNFSRTQVSDGSDLFRTATLRGLQPDQTLVLVNGKRRHNQAIFGFSGTVGAGAAGTDLNAIPLTALQSVQVLRDGAAAQYGSDAIAGVINLVLRDSTDSTSGFIQGGATGEGDGENLAIGVNTGIDLGSDGGFINVTAEYRDSASTNRAQRDIGGSSTTDYGTLSDEVRWGQGNPESTFLSTFYNMMIPIKDLELYSFGGFSNRTALGNALFRNYNEASKNVPQVYADGFLPRIDNEAEDISLSLGLRGEINDDWEFDLSAVYGQNTYDFSSENTINASYSAEYLFENPSASDSDITSNSGPTSGYSGGFRFDQLTVNADFTGALDIGHTDSLYISFGAEYRVENYEIVAGEVASYACGKANGDSSFPSVIDDNAFAECGFQAYPGLRPKGVNSTDRNSYAAYIDLEIQLNDSWLLGSAFRYEDFSDSGDDLVWKLSSRYDFDDDFAIRGAVSTGFRAPSLQQSGYTAYTSNLGAGGVLQPSFTAVAGAPFPSALGVDSLGLETSENLSLGIIYDITDEITVTIDAYDIKVKDRITLGGMLTVDDVAFNQGAVDALIATGATQANFFSNAVDTNTKGVDLIITYNTDFYGGQFSAVLAGNINETQVDNVNAPEGIPESVAFDNVQRSFLTDGQPKERGTLTFNYSKDSWGATLRTNYFGETDVIFFGNDHIGLPDSLSPTGSFKPTSTVESAVLVDINIDYEINEQLAFAIGINNLFDQTPDELGSDEVLDFATNQAMKYPLRAVPYGFDGMSYYARINFSF